MVVALRVGDVVRLKKVHPCGGYLWQVYRLGADIGLRCRTCSRRVLLPRTQVERRMRQVVPREPLPGEEEADSVDTPLGRQ